eukprot:scaffold17914_cov31-Tisochrysis_lutea.AAC.3
MGGVRRDADVAGCEKGTQGRSSISDVLSGALPNPIVNDRATYGIAEIEVAARGRLLRGRAQRSRARVAESALQDLLALCKEQDMI